MAGEGQIVKAADAIKALVPVGYGMTWEEAKGYAKAALMAAETEREIERRRDCKHSMKSSSGTIRSDGSGSCGWTCSNCGQSGHEEWGRATWPHFEKSSTYAAIGISQMKGVTRELSESIRRDVDGIRCECGGYAERDSNITREEIKGRGCGRDTPTYQCCARAFVCAVCGTRWLGSAEAPEME